ncbi:hypothetical protein U732_2536 [Clostridium argentinense CDC 2741]|uniref:DUF445 family protein n=1 Tax=Clostridium argentinense CDC 2741 TaxID=1418104 RepID=A0A0C1QWN9_9CLOT|nr:DUF445 family protein [Clostridium argentinense]ARC86895.1 hypothetical protein RSJ17_21570 [Clostridium argentinense]KIE45402.1 hypothetical protein U732_2536 [Clostridium argentinense CDC 2741]NFF40983.1 DUF445 family protein [Clostridium argentinense]NFP51518.1 DUF445 family protein [Clostridium argentinense]NFP73577.1 DUF445 family protein [Clostridium argentinense]
MKYIIGSIVGAVIGYLTNWLAIKMLFRPHKELRIGSFKIPFTPGLIPKEKERISKSVGETVGDHLLTKETILEALCNDNINEGISNYVGEKFKELQSSDITIEDKAKELLNDNYNKIYYGIRDSLSKSLLENVRSIEFKKAICEAMTIEIKNKLKNNPKEFLGNNVYNTVKESLIARSKGYIDSDELKRSIEKVLNDKMRDLDNCDKSLNDIIPKGLTSNLKIYTYNKRYDISSYIKTGIKGEKAEAKIKDIITEALSGMSPMIAMFIKSDSIYEKIVNGAEELLSQEQNITDIVMVINDIIDKILETKLSEIINNTSKEGKDSAVETISNFFIEQLKENDIVENLLNKLEEKFCSMETLEDVLENMNFSYDEVINNMIIKIVDNIVYKEDFVDKIKSIVEYGLNSVTQKSSRSLLVNTNGETVNKLSKVLINLYKKFIDNKAPQLIERFNIARIIEDKINSFDVMFVEKLILDIASKELKAITWLGALLGGIMGLLSPLLSSL